MSQAVPVATDRVLGALWLSVIVLLLMVRELYRSMASPGLTPIWWGISIASTVLVVGLAFLAFLRLTDDDRTPTGMALAVLLVLYSPIHAGLVFGLFGDVATAFTFNSILQMILYPILTLLSLVILLGGRQRAESVVETPE